MKKIILTGLTFTTSLALCLSPAYALTTIDLDLTAAPSFDFGTGTWDWSNYDTKKMPELKFNQNGVIAGNDTFTVTSTVANVSGNYTINAKVADLPDGAKIVLEGDTGVNGAITNTDSVVVSDTVSLGVLGSTHSLKVTSATLDYSDVTDFSAIQTLDNATITYTIGTDVLN